jgi:hypothetical protein
MMIYCEFYTPPTIVPYSAWAEIGTCSSLTASVLMASEEKGS